MAGSIPIHVTNRAKEYPLSVGKEPEVPSSAPSSSSGPLHIERPIIDEGASTYIMSIACWKAIRSPTLSQSPMNLEAFDGRESRPYGILQRLPITLEGKTVEVEVEVVDANLTYNLLLGRSWTYAMRAVASSLFHCIYFPHQGKIVTVD
eukprot:PITA_30521